MIHSTSNKRTRSDLNVDANEASNKRLHTEKKKDDGMADSPQTPTSASGTTALWKAITLTTLDMKALYQYIKTKGDLSVTNDDGYGLVYLAARNDSMEALRLLLLTADDDFNVNALHGPHQEMALHAAASVGSFDAVELLLEHGSDVDCRDSLGHTPLSNALFAKAKTCVDLLVTSGAALDTVDAQGNTLLHLAVSKQFTEAISLLIEKGVSIDQQNHRGLSSLAIAIGFGFQDVVKLLLEEGGADVDGKTRVATVLHHAVTWNRMEALQALVDRGANINAINAMEETPLLVAVQQRKIDMVRYLVEKGADPSYCHSDTSSPSSTNPPLLYAANHGYTELCSLLITKDTSNYFIQMAADMSDRASFGLTAKYLRNKINERLVTPESAKPTPAPDMALHSSPSQSQSSLSTPITSTTATAPTTTMSLDDEEDNRIVGSPSRLFDTDFSSLINTFSDDEDPPNDSSNQVS
ncbi:hypothetical protein [Absidia glauca]|uniref:Uncharacterized protein n=1 Tax=Absidia glauca TaxID=4829 RepID=A0A168QW08_ABSGL|nr:hypothetical protein [Absidia glauca]